MPKLNMSIKHSLSQDEALSRIRGLLGDVKDQYGDQISHLEETWFGNNADFKFKAAGFGVSGTLKVTSSDVKLEGKLPWAANLFKGKIESTIRDRAQSLLA